MVEYIDKKETVRIVEFYGLQNGSALGRHSGIADMIARSIEALPPADIAPVRHGRWADGQCTACGWEEPDDVQYDGYELEPWAHTLYCPNCGALMMGGKRMKGINLCSECGYYSMKKHKCTRGAKDEGEPTARFYADCPLDDVTPVQRWIPVTERLPEVLRWVIVCREADAGVRKVEQGMYTGNGWWKVYGTNVKRIICWMPMPEPPKEDA